MSLFVFGMVIDFDKVFSAVIKDEQTRLFSLDFEIKIKNHAMAKSTPKPPNGPSTTGKPSGGGRGNNPPRPKGK